MLAQAESLAADLQQPWVDGTIMLMKGVARFMGFRWPAAQQLLSEASDTFRNQCAGMTWELDTANIFSLYCLLYRGQWKALAARRQQLAADARVRGDLYADLNMNTLLLAATGLAADQPSLTRQQVQTAIAGWSGPSFFVQHLTARLAVSQIDLYHGAALTAWRRLHDLWPMLRKSHLLKVRWLRIEYWYRRGVCALAVLKRHPHDRGAAGDVVLAVRRLSRENTRWSDALAGLIEGRAAVFRGADSAAAERTIQSAAHVLDELDMNMLAHAARWRSGEMIEGDEGRELVDEARQWMIEQGIVRPERTIDSLMP